MLCPRGFLITRNVRTGEMRPFFIKVREDDIVWKGAEGETADIIKAGLTDGWLWETHSKLNRVSLKKKITIPVLTQVSTRVATFTVKLPKDVRADNAVIIAGKNSNNGKVLQNCSVEAELIETDETTGLSYTLQISLISPLGELTESNLAIISGSVMIDINGFTE